MESLSTHQSNATASVISTEDFESVNFEELQKNGTVIGTHSGVFHCDEVLACCLLKYTKFANSTIVRSRNSEIHDKVDILVDVGGTFDEGKNRFDHHQREFDGYFNAEKYPGIKMSSAGLIYKYYGMEIIKNIAQKWEIELDSIPDQDWDELYTKFYKSLILEVDAIDNGVNILNKDQGDPRYTIHTGLATRVGRLNPSWNVENPDESVQFKKAMDIAEEEFLSMLYSSLKIVRPAYEIVKSAYENRKEFHESGEMIWFPKSCPWKSHLFKIEEENDEQGLIKFAFF